MALSVSRQLVRLIRQKEITQRDLDVATKFVVDGMSCSFAGAKTDLGANLSASTIDPFFRAAAHAHILEMDDLHRASVTHPGCVVVPVAWILHQSLGTSREKMLRGVLHGYEAMCRVGAVVGKSHYKIFHNTSTVGVFGAAMAACSMMDLDEDQCVWALGSAGTQAAGLWEFAKESPPAASKPAHAGFAARNGVHSAQLANLGISGASRIFEGDAGFFAALTKDDANVGQVARSRPEADWQLHATSIKPWPSCRHTHAPIEAALSLSANGVSGDSKVHVETYGAALALCNRAVINSKFDAQFSIQHCVRSALLDGRIDQESFSGESFARQLPIVTVSHSPSFEEAYPLHWGATVSLDGDSQSRTDSLGDPEAPLSIEQVMEKSKMMGVDVNIFAKFIEG